MLHRVKMVIEMSHQKSLGSITFTKDFEIEGMFKQGIRTVWLGGKRVKDLKYDCVVQKQEYDFHGRTNSVECHTVRHCRQALQAVGWWEVIDDLEQGGWKICGATGTGLDAANELGEITPPFKEAKRCSRGVEGSNFVVSCIRCRSMSLAIYATDEIGAWNWFECFFGETEAKRELWDVMPLGQFRRKCPNVL